MKIITEILIECPECGKGLKKECIVTKNSYGLNLYSDGNYHGDHLNKIIEITRCPFCKQYFWISDARIVGEKIPVPEQKISSPEPSVQHLELQELIEVLNIGLINENKKKEFYLRQQIWYAYNLNYLNKNSEPDDFYEINLLNLERLLSIDIQYQRIMAAEINRNLGNFSKASELLEVDFSDKLRLIADKIKAQLALKNKKTFILY